MPEIKIMFPRLNNFWNDSGVLGLYRCLKGDVHADPQPGADDPEGSIDERFGIQAILSRDALDVAGEEKAVQDALEAAYDRLVIHYYDLSTQKQWEETKNYNFFFNREKDRFEAFPKKKARGIAAFIYDKAPRPGGDQTAWADKTPGKLSEEWRHLQARLDAFLAQNGITAGPPAGMLLDGPNRVRPNITIAVRERKPKGTCFLCGCPSSTLEKVSQAVFPFITGESGVLSFFPEGEVVKACWRCAFVGKFVPANGFFIASGERLHMFFPFAPSLTKINEIYDQLKTVVRWEPNFWRNFELQLGGYFVRSHEVAFAFLHAVYQKLFLHAQDDAGQTEFEQALYQFAFGSAQTKEEAPVSFAVITTEQKGNTQMPTESYLFDNLVYLFRIFREGEQRGTSWKDLAQNLVDHTTAKSEDSSLRRNRMMGLILKKKSILGEAEAFAYRVNRTGRQYIAPLVQFVTFYEGLLKKGGPMEDQSREAAVTLGRRIGAAVAKDRGKKGNLFALRKCRSVSDFLNELNRIQFRYEVAIPPAVYEGHLTQENFPEFRGFCMLAALNSFNAGVAAGQEKAESTT